MGFQLPTSTGEFTGFLVAINSRDHAGRGHPGGSAGFGRAYSSRGGSRQSSLGDAQMKVDISHTIHVNGIFTYVLVDFFMVNVGIYTIHGCYGYAPMLKQTEVLKSPKLPDPLSQIACMSVSEGALQHRSR